MGAPPDAKREHARVKPASGQPIEVHIMGDGFLEVLRARDISVGGLAVFVSHDFNGCDIDDPVDVIIKLGQERPFTVRGIIRHASRHANDHFFGVKFSNLSAEHMERIRRYVERRLAEGGAV